MTRTSDLAVEQAFAPDWAGLGYVLAIVGCFLLANGILFRNPRALVAERLGRAPQHLRRIREFIFHRVQMGLGFAFLVGGFASMLGGRYQTVPPQGSLVMWIGLVIVLAVLLEVVGWWWSTHSLRSHVRDFLRENPPEFETDPALAREVGELFGVETRADETVQSYAARLRHSLGLAVAASRGSRSRADEPVQRGRAAMFGEDSEPGFEET
ncbi:MAG: hypothetical protein IT454_20795 [Planctomycetes bacterium]|nr:hypothetical protein [Planctomycetota bacterium]